MNNRNKLKQTSSSSFESDDVLTIAPSLSTEIRLHHHLPSRESKPCPREPEQDQLDSKKSPPAVLPKPKPKKKPKFPPKSPSRPGYVSPNDQELAVQLSQVRLKNGVHEKEMAGANGDDNTDGAALRNKVKVERNFAKRPILLQQVRSAGDHPNEAKNPGRHFPRQDAVTDDDMEDALYSSVDFASLGFSKAHNPVEPESPNPYAISNMNPTNHDPKQSQREDASDRVFSSSKSTPVDLVGQEGRNVVHILSNLGIKEAQSVVNGGTSYSVGENKDVYSLPVNNGGGQDGHSVVHISPNLGIKEAQSVVNGGSSYSVGGNNDVYSLPVNNGGQDGDNVVQPSPILGIKEVQSVLKDDTAYSIGYNNDIYSLPVNSTASENEGEDSYAYTGPHAEIQSLEQESKLSSSSKEDEPEGLYAETDLYFQEASPVNTVYEIPGSIVKTSPRTPRRRAPPINNGSKPPNFKRPPPPPPLVNKPTFETNKQKHTPAVPKTAPPKDIPVQTTSSQLPRELRQKFRNSDSSSSNESLNTKKDEEPIFASRSDIGFSEANSNNNRHLVATSPPRNAEKTRASPPLGLYFVNVCYHDPSKIFRNNDGSDMPPIVPPPPFSSPILDSKVMVVPPPPPMRDNDTSCTPVGVQPPPPIYPPPRIIRPSEQAELDVNSQKSYMPDYSQDDVDDESQWLGMVDGLPPPPPDLLEDTPRYENVRY